MLKILGLIMIIGSCSAIGFSVSKSYIRRTNSIKYFISVLETVKAELVFNNRSTEGIIDIVLSCSDDQYKKLFDALKSNISDTESNPKQASEEIRSLLKDYSLKDNESTEIINIFSRIGKYDSANQVELLNNSITRLEQMKKQAEDDQTKNGKLFSTLGATVGIILALILF